LANEISFTLGLSVTNLPASTIPIPQSTTQYSQSSPGVAAAVLDVAIGTLPEGQIQPSSIVPAPGMILAQNISQNNADVMYFVYISTVWYKLGTLKPGQWLSMPSYDDSAYTYGFAGVSAPGIVQVFALGA
jgi:hypothetical protein